jgi:hypothetical protein
MIAKCAAPEILDEAHMHHEDIRRKLLVEERRMQIKDRRRRLAASKTSERECHTLNGVKVCEVNADADGEIQLTEEEEFEARGVAYVLPAVHGNAAITSGVSAARRLSGSAGSGKVARRLSSSAASGSSSGSKARRSTRGVSSKWARMRMHKHLGH